MSNPRFRPSIYAANPRDFGKHETMTWVVTREISEREMASAARFQHYFAHRILLRLRHLNLTLRAYSSMSGQNYDRLIKVQRGETVMKLEEVFRAELLLGNVIDPTGTPFDRFVSLNQDHIQMIPN
jgi:flagellar biosynthesis/type III secretory pathway ATPase